MPISHPLQHVIVAKVKSIDAKIGREVVHQEESQVYIDRICISLPKVHYHDQNKAHAECCQRKLPDDAECRERFKHCKNAVLTGLIDASFRKAKFETGPQGECPDEMPLVVG